MDLFNQEVEQENVEIKSVEAKSVSFKIDKEPLRIKKVVIQNYKNIAYLEIDTHGGESVLFEGQNGLGKSNRLEAIFWCITGNLPDGTSKSDKQEVKPKDSDNDVVTSVRIEFTRYGYTFERRLREKYTSKGEYNGTETTLLVNGGVEKNIKNAMTSLYDFLGVNDLVNRFAMDSTLSNFNVLELLYNAETIKNADYKLLRALVIDMVGEPNYMAVIKENELKYGRLTAELGLHANDLEATKKSLKYDIMDKQNGLRQQVEVAKGMVQSFDEEASKVVDEQELAHAKQETARINSEISELELELKGNQGNITLKYDKAISDLRNEIYARQGVIRQEHEKKLAELKDTKLEQELKDKRASRQTLQGQLNQANADIEDLNYNKKGIQRTIDSKQEEIRILDDVLERLSRDYELWLNPQDMGREFTCPHCNKPFFEHELDDHKKYVKKQLEQVDKDGQKTSEQQEALKEGIETLQGDIELINESITKAFDTKEQLEKNIAELDKAITALQQRINEQATKLPVLDLENDDTVKSLRDEINAQNEAKNKALVDFEGHREQLMDKITALNEEHDKYWVIVDQERMIDYNKEKAQQKRNQLKDLKNRLTDREELYTLVKELEKEMYQSLDTRISGKFGENIQFKLWKLNVSNDEYDTRLCDMYVRDSHGTLVNITRLNTGLYPIMIADFLSHVKAHYGIEKSFIFVDELASLDNEHKAKLLGYGEQVFATAVSESKTIEQNKL